MITRKQKYRDIDIERTWCLEGTLNFSRYFFKKKNNKKFIVNDHHIQICEALDKVIAGKIKKLIINIAPRYSKTEIVVKSFTGYGLALNPKSKFIHLSYSDDLARDNSTEINTLVDSPEYKRLFEARTLNSSSKKWSLQQGGGFYAVSSSGQVTGFGAGVVPEEESEEQRLKREADELSEMDEFMPGWDSEFAGAIIIDDPIKPDDARSETVREKVNFKFETTIRNRVNSRDTPIIIIMQRLHENDLCGYLMDLEPDEWTVLSLPAIYEDENGEEKALWPFKHTLEELKKIKNANSFVFETQYLQNPKPIEGLMYTTFRTYEPDAIPISINNKKKNYTDTADEGKDYLCSINYEELPNGNCYLTDVLFTKKPMEYTEVKTAEMLCKRQVRKVKVESNNGGRGFARAVEKIVREMGNKIMKFEWFHQSENKNVRIFNKSAEVQNMIFYPSDWAKRWPEFHKHVTSYRKEGKNEHDDAEDTLTGIVESIDKPKQTNKGSFFSH